MCIQFAIIGNAGTRELKHTDTPQKGVGGAPRQHRGLPRKQPVPHRMLIRGELVPVLRHGPICIRPGRRRFIDVADIFHANWLHLKPLGSNRPVLDLRAFDDIRPSSFVYNLNTKRCCLFQF